MLLVFGLFLFAFAVCLGFGLQFLELGSLLLGEDFLKLRVAGFSDFLHRCPALLALELARCSTLLLVFLVECGQCLLLVGSQIQLLDHGLNATTAFPGRFLVVVSGLRHVHRHNGCNGEHN